MYIVNLTFPIFQASRLASVALIVLYLSQVGTSFKILFKILTFYKDIAIEFSFTFYSSWLSILPDGVYFLRNRNIKKDLLPKGAEAKTMQYMRHNGLAVQDDGTLSR